MSTHSVAEARNKLSELIQRAEAGEDVVITRHGAAVVELRALKPALRRVTPEQIDWLVKHRVSRLKKTQNAGELLSQMRDEDGL